MYAKECIWLLWDLFPYKRNSLECELVPSLTLCWTLIRVETSVLGFLCNKHSVGLIKLLHQHFAIVILAKCSEISPNFISHWNIHMIFRLVTIRLRCRWLVILALNTEATHRILTYIHLQILSLWSNQLLVLFSVPARNLHWRALGVLNFLKCSVNKKEIKYFLSSNNCRFVCSGKQNKMSANILLKFSNIILMDNSLPVSGKLKFCFWTAIRRILIYLTPYLQSHLENYLCKSLELLSRK